MVSNPEGGGLRRLLKAFGQRFRAGAEGPALYRLPSPPKPPPLGLPDEVAVGKWLGQQETDEEVYAQLFWGCAEELEIVRHLPEPLLTEEVLWACLGDVRHQLRHEALLANSALRTEHLALLSRRVRGDLEILDESRKRSEAFPPEEGTIARRVQALGYFLDSGAGERLAEAKEEMEALTLCLAQVQGPSSQRVCWRRNLARTLLQSACERMEDSQLTQLGQAFAMEAEFAEAVLKGARSGEPALALWEGLSAEAMGRWAEQVSQSEVAMQSARVRELAFAHGSEEARLRVQVAEFQEMQPELYLTALQRLWQQSRGSARAVLARYPVPAGVLLPPDFMAEMLSGGTVEERLGMIRTLGSAQVAHMAPVSGDFSAEVAQEGGAVSSPSLARPGTPRTR